MQVTENVASGGEGMPRSAYGACSGVDRGWRLRDVELPEVDERMEGVVRRILFESPERDFQLVIIDREGAPVGDETVVVARNAALDVGERATFGGGWRERKGRRQFEAEWIERMLPTTLTAIRSWLEKSTFFRGVGPRRAEAIVEHFGLDTLRVLDESPERLREVPSLPQEVADRVANEWGKRASIRAVILFLQGVGISPNLAFRIHQRYAARAVAIVRENPYRLARDVRGVGFQTADQIARSLGIVGDDPRRVEAGLLHELHELGLEGHTRMARERLVETAAARLSVDRARVEGCLDLLATSGKVVLERGSEGEVFVYERDVFALEEELAIAFAVRAGQRGAVPSLDLAGLRAVEDALDFALADGQRDALLQVAGAAVAVLTGGPGTGKTTLIRALVLHAERHGRLVKLAAPTGRAARRMTESTGLEALTVHRLLEVDPAGGGFRRDAENPLVCDLLIVDESSMLDLALAAALMRAVAEGTSVIFVGDVDQLPSVGAGDVLRDVIESGVVPVARLRRVFRQGADSRIVDAAHAALSGHAIESEQGSGGQYFFIAAEDAERAVERVVQVVAERMPQAFALDPVRDVQVLVPMHSGPVGTRAINGALGERIGGRGAMVERSGHRYRVGDKVMQTRNNYQLECFNGDIGFVSWVDASAGTLRVDYGGPSDVEYSREAVDDLVPAWAISVHKSQGSEFRAVVLVLSTHHWVMLQRNLIYTAITRARERLVIIGSRTALQRALREADAERRSSGLGSRMRAAKERFVSGAP